MSDRVRALGAALTQKKSEFNSALTVVITALPAISTPLAKRLVDSERDSDFQTALREFASIIQHVTGDDKQRLNTSEAAAKTKDSEIDKLRALLEEQKRQNTYVRLFHLSMRWCDVR